MSQFTLTGDAAEAWLALTKERDAALEETARVRASLGAKLGELSERMYLLEASINATEQLILAKFDYVRKGLEHIKKATPLSRLFGVGAICDDLLKKLA